MPALQETIDKTKETYLQAAAQLRAAFANIPDERLNWSPSPTSRTPIQIVAHCAAATNFIREQMDGTPFPLKNTEEADSFFREWERQFHTRAQALELLDEASAKHLAWLEGLTEERLQFMAELPFGLGSAPVEAWLDIAANHTRSHVPQLEYIQTIYGDKDWRLS